MSASYRRTELQAEAERLTSLLVRQGAQLVVAFGSFARGDVRPGSDLDLLVVLDANEPFGTRLVRLHELLIPQVALDLLAYTPHEFEAVKDRPFIRRALEEGVVLHAVGDVSWSNGIGVGL
jgi:uncharacterized protein